MSADPRAALAQLIAAFERHFEVASTRRDPDDATVTAAGQDLAEAFDAYDDALFEATECTTPLGVYGDDDEYDEFDDDDYDSDDDDDDDEGEDDAEDSEDVVDVDEDDLPGRAPRRDR